MKQKLRYLFMTILTMLLCISPAFAIQPLEDGEYAIDIEMSGGSGKAAVESPARMIQKNGESFVRLTWSSSNYDYMIVDGKKYLNESEEEANSSFTVPITAFNEEVIYTADTLAMGTPHEVEYTFWFDARSIGPKSRLPQEGAKRVLVMAAFIIVGGGILNHFVKKSRARDYTGKKR